MSGEVTLVYSLLVKHILFPLLFVVMNKTETPINLLLNLTLFALKMHPSSTNRPLRNHKAHEYKKIRAFSQPGNSDPTISHECSAI